MASLLPISPMTIDVYTATGSKNGTLDLPAALFGARINHGLMHQAIVLQQSNRRVGTAHAKNRGEVAGSTRKLYAQKGTGRARRGSIRSPLLRGGGKAFGPRSDSNFTKEMPKAMRRAALFSTLSYKAKQGAIVGLEDFGGAKTKEMAGLLTKMPVDIGRRILFVLPEKQEAFARSARNIPGVKIITASYLNPEDVLNSRHLIFVGNAVEKAEQVFGTKTVRVKAKVKDPEDVKESKEKKAPRAKKPAAKKSATAKKSSDSSAS
ncbi:MAG: ribosomal protein [Candidatus Peribacteria bacterium]|nr:ribosomal protein [Candidatus Peribacteria bacterium]